MSGNGTKRMVPCLQGVCVADRPDNGRVEMQEETPALSDAQMERVWQEMLSAEIRSCYFADLVERLGKRQRWLTWGTLVASSGAFVSFLLEYPALAQLRPVFALSATGISFSMLVQQYPRRSMDAADLHLRWNKLAHDYERLWENVYTADAPQLLDALTTRAEEISRAGAAFRWEPKVMLRWEKHVVSRRLRATS